MHKAVLFQDWTHLQKVKCSWQLVCVVHLHQGCHWAQEISWGGKRCQPKPTRETPNSTKSTIQESSTCTREAKRIRCLRFSIQSRPAAQWEWAKAKQSSENIGTITQINWTFVDQHGSNVQEWPKWSPRNRSCRTTEDSGDSAATIRSWTSCEWTNGKGYKVRQESQSSELLSQEERIKRATQKESKIGASSPRRA